MGLHYDGAFEFFADGIGAMAPDADCAAAVIRWLDSHHIKEQPRKNAGVLMLRAWWRMTTDRSFDEEISVDEMAAGVQSALEGKTLEVGWLKREHNRPARYEVLVLDEL